LALKTHKKDIKFVWIPAHMGIVLNEMADALAKESIWKGEDAQYLIPDTDVKSYWKTKLGAVAEKRYTESGKQKGRKYFEYYYPNNRKRWLQRFRFQTKSIISMNTIRSGHYCLKECFIHFNIVDTEMCECSKAKETIDHTLWQCKLFEKFRVQMVDELVKHKTFPLYCIDDILHSTLPETVIPVVWYTNSINVRI
jgi:hypothetical protein